MIERMCLRIELDFFEAATVNYERKMFSDDFHLQLVHPVLRQVDVHDPVRVLLEVVNDVAEVLPEPI